MLIRPSLCAWLLATAVLIQSSQSVPVRAAEDSKPEAAAATEKSGDADAQAVKTVEAKIGKLTLVVPENWKQSEPSSRLRLGQFAIPKAEGDEEDGELAIFNFGGGGDIRANVDRWIGQFTAEGRESKVTQGEIENGRYVFVEVTGTYLKPVGPPIQQKTVATPGSRMLGVILGREDLGLFFLKMTGSDKTIKAQADALRRSFSGDVKTEKPLEFK